MQAPLALPKLLCNVDNSIARPQQPVLQLILHAKKHIVRSCHPSTAKDCSLATTPFNPNAGDMTVIPKFPFVCDHAGVRRDENGEPSYAWLIGHPLQGAEKICAHLADIPTNLAGSLQESDSFVPANVPANIFAFLDDTNPNPQACAYANEAMIPFGAAKCVAS